MWRKQSFCRGPICERLNRREFFRAAAVLPSVFACQRSLADEFHPSDFWERPRYVWMRRPETGEQIREVYWADGRLLDDAYRRVSWFMRDLVMERRLAALTARGEPTPSGWYAAVGMDPVLLDILYATCGWLEHFGIKRPLVLDSGLRHPVRNAVTEGAAKNSQHQYGRAGDVVIPGVSATSVASYGVWLSAGGVGFYPAKNFTHLDSGRVRSWVDSSTSRKQPQGAAVAKARPY